MSKYITNKDILEIVGKWDKEQPIPEELGEAFLTIARNLSNKANFIGYTWKDEMIAEAVFTCVKYFKNFDPEKSKNPFAYITRICYHSFVNSIKKHNKHGQIKQDLYDNKDRVDHHSFFTYNSIDYTDFRDKETQNTLSISKHDTSEKDIDNNENNRS